jgi:acyl dehydratase
VGLVITYSELTGKIGADLGVTDWMTISQNRIDGFADATDDRQWIHVDAEKAASGPFGKTIAHGYLTLALINKFLPDLLMVTETSMGINYGCEKVRFPSPVTVDSRVRGKGRLLDVEIAAAGLQVVVQVTVEIDAHDRPACVADTISRFYPE